MRANGIVPLAHLKPCLAWLQIIQVFFEWDDAGVTLWVVETLFYIENDNKQNQVKWTRHTV